MPGGRLHGSPVSDALNISTVQENIKESKKEAYNQEMIKNLQDMRDGINKSTSGQQTNIIQGGGQSQTGSGDWPPTYFEGDMLSQFAVGILNMIRGT